MRNLFLSLLVCCSWTSYGHSGTTILDILLGSSEDAFSCGELTFINRAGLADEFCSCNNRIGQCGFWSPVMKSWSGKSPLSLKDYKKLRNLFDCPFS